MPSNVSLRAVVAYGTLSGPGYTVIGGALQLAGQFSYPQALEIVGYQASFIATYDYAVIPVVPAAAALVVGVRTPAYQLGPAVSNGQAIGLGTICWLQAATLYQPNTAYAGSANAISGSAQAAVAFPDGYTLKILPNTPISTYIRLPSNAADNQAQMTVILFVNVLIPPQA